MKFTTGAQSRMYSPKTLRGIVKRWQKRWHFGGQLGLAMTAIGGAWIWSTLTSGAILATILLALPFTLFGIIIAALGLIGRYSPWVHIRIRLDRDRWPHHLAFSFPLPVNEIAWLVNAFGNYISSEKRLAVTEFLTSVREQISPEQPVYVELAGERIEERIQVLVS